MTQLRRKHKSKSFKNKRKQKTIRRKNKRGGGCGCSSPMRGGKRRKRKTKKRNRRRRKQGGVKGLKTFGKALSTGYLSTLGITPESRFDGLDLKHPQGQIARPNYSLNDTHTTRLPGFHKSLSDKQIGEALKYQKDYNAYTADSLGESLGIANNNMVQQVNHALANEKPDKPLWALKAENDARRKRMAERKRTGKSGGFSSPMRGGKRKTKKRNRRKRSRRRKQKGGNLLKPATFKCNYNQNIGAKFTGVKNNTNPFLPDPKNNINNKKGGGVLSTFGMGDLLLNYYKGTDTANNIPIRFKGGKPLVSADPMVQPKLTSPVPRTVVSNIPNIYNKASYTASGI